MGGVIVVGAGVLTGGIAGGAAVPAVIGAAVTVLGGAGRKWRSWW